MRNPEAPRCAWCDLRCRNQAELIEHQRACEQGETCRDAKAEPAP